MVIHAIYENGVFKPTQPVDLPERCEVEFEPRRREIGKETMAAMEEIYKILSRSYETGDPHLAERHNEHQP